MQILPILKKYAPWIVILLLGLMIGRLLTDNWAKDEAIRDRENQIQTLMLDIEVIVKERDKLEAHGEVLKKDLESRDSIIEVQTKEKQQVVAYYNRKLSDYRDLTAQQADSAIVARYPETPADSLGKKVIVDLVEGDKNKELVGLQVKEIEMLKAKSLVQLELINNQDSIIFNLKEQVAKQDKIRQEYEAMVDAMVKDHRKHVRKIKWQRNGAVLGAVAIGILALL